ncbi:hypothetical protein BGZ70_002714 [Mortierella alpina]|uniref:Homeobox domain-containing protein n=1 Tax=Mortierella alpina TaxID=64518 RepID=A0A9P6M595_MORAP|nr:hypothetical protein BGZ70_002714 [Mortierella alpina]
MAGPVIVTSNASRTRKNYTNEQKIRLEALFQRNPNPSIQERILVASEINETEARGAIRDSVGGRRAGKFTLSSVHCPSKGLTTTEESGREEPQFCKAHRLGPLLLGGSVAKPENMLRIAELMASVSDMGGRRYILNALLSTKLRPIQQRFLQTSGPKLLGLWIKNAMEDPHSPECHETVTKAIKILKELPFDLEKLSEFKLGKIIKQIATGKEGSQVLIRSAAELKDQWLGLINSTDTLSLPSNMTASAAGAKKTISKGISIPFFGDNQAREMAQLPKFTKAKPGATSAPKSPRITSNPGFFNEIAPLAPSAPTPNSKARASSAHKGNSRVDFGSSSSVTNLRQTAASASSGTGRPLVDSRPPQSKVPLGPVVINPQPTLTTANRARSLAFNASSSQHDKAREAGLKLIHKKKTVRFKADFELVQIKYFERVVYEDDEDDEEGAHDRDDDRDQDIGRDMDVDHYWRDDVYGGGNASWIEAREKDTTNRSTFTMADSVLEDLIQGAAWRHPIPLLIVHPVPLDDEEASCELAHGEESLEKEIQGRREDITEPQIYTDVASIPPSPAEPELESVLEPVSNPQADQEEEVGGTRAIPLFEVS